MRSAATLAPAPREAAVEADVRVLVVDDEPGIVEVIRHGLARAGIEVVGSGTGRDLAERVAVERPDLVVLDLVLPDATGLEVLAALRRSSTVPVILLSATADVAERVEGLELGADDFVSKPFSPRELTARVRAVLRRTTPPASGAADFGDLCIDPEARSVVVRGEPAVLTTKEFDLLAFLASSPRRVFTRDGLLRRVWGSTSEWQDPSTVTEHVRRIRSKIEADPGRPRWIITVRGIGYRFEP